MRRGRSLSQMSILRVVSQTATGQSGCRHHLADHPRRNEFVLFVVVVFSYKYIFNIIKKRVVFVFKIIITWDTDGSNPRP